MVEWNVFWQFMAQLLIIFIAVAFAAVVVIAIIEEVRKLKNKKDTED